MPQCIMIQSVSSRVMMAIWGLVLKKENASEMQLGVGKISLARVCIAIQYNTTQHNATQRNATQL